MANDRPQILLLAILATALTSISCHTDEEEDFQPAGGHKVEFGEAKAPRYLLWDVNPGEGFNLRRDVYLRMANLVENLSEDSPWILVLPPWGPLYHWTNRHIDQSRIPWSLFFDVPSLRKYVPVIEFEDFLKVLPKPWLVDEVYYLQYYKEGWGGEWKEKMDKRECHTMEYRKYTLNEKSGLWDGWFFNYGEEVHAKAFQCMSVQGMASFLKPFLLHNTTGMSVMIDRAETVMHDRFGDVKYWTARRSMVFAKHLKKIGDDFRGKHLDSTDVADKTVMNEDWTKNKKTRGEAKGGPYIGVHLRRADFAISRKKDTPTFSAAAEKIIELLKKYDLKKVFIATDAREEWEFDEVKNLLSGYEVYRFRPSKEILEKYMDGGVAIIDQWICAHARYFIGTRESTFSFRIQDEREIMGFDSDLTFNSFCGQGRDKGEEKPNQPDDYEEDFCRQPSRWEIVY
ncbi:GDP-fucose protein O-fucosyltransferase 2-like [Haliotis cracherodii]|uniref:GDP-fucose protein O-fucosyltransferase 2-like n=1 Tax=Haliotis cracherodii TaxID=6455 RepID=UPI0039EC5815